MRIQAITNLRSHNNYQVKAHNITKNYSTSPMAVDTFTPSVAFKGLREAQKAIDNDDAEALRREIENGLDVNSILDTVGKNPLIEYAGFMSSINCFRELRKQGVNMYAENINGNFCFSYACFWGNNDIVQELVNDPEYNINYQDTKYRWNGLMRACSWGQEDIVDTILQRPDVDLTLEDKKGNTAKDIAREKGYDKIVEKLQAYVPGVDRRTGITGANKVNQAAFDMKRIQEAIEKDDAEALRHEIAKGLDVNRVLNTNDKDPLIEYAGLIGSINCLRELRKHDVNMYAEDKYGNFCFSIACSNGHNDIVQELVNDSEYNINYQDTIDGWNGLMRACFWGKEDIVDIILKRDDVDVTLKDKNEQTAEDLARQEGFDKIVEKLQAYVKGVDRRTGVIKKQADAETEKSIREAVTEQIRKEEQEKAEKALANKQAELAKREEAIAKKEANLENAIKTKAEEIIADEKAQLAQKRKEAQAEKDAYQNLINIEKELIAEEVEAQKFMFLESQGTNTDKLPQNMDFDTQTVVVLKVLSSRQDKLANTDDENMPDEITIALQDNNKKISRDVLDFLGNVIDVSREKCSKEDLLAAIQAVKNELGHLDWKKSAKFLANLSWGKNTIQSVVKKLQTTSVKA